MRRSLLALIAVAILFSAPAAMAAPTCQDVNGGTIRCGTPGAMPVGWTLPFEQRLESGWVNPLAFQSEGPFLSAVYLSLTGVDALYWFNTSKVNYDLDPFFPYQQVRGQRPLMKWRLPGPQLPAQAVRRPVSSASAAAAKAPASS